MVHSARGVFSLPRAEFEERNRRFSLSFAKGREPAFFASIWVGSRRDRRVDEADRRSRAAPGALRSSSRLNKRQILAVLEYPPAEDLLCGRRWRDRSAEERAVLEARQPARYCRQAARNQGSSGSRRGGIQRTHRKVGVYVARPTPVTGTCLLRHIPGSARLLTGSREANAPDSTAVLRLSGENRGGKIQKRERSVKSGQNRGRVEKDMVYPPRYPPTVAFQDSYRFVEVPDLTSMGGNGE